MRMSVYEASRKLGISEAAVRQRFYRGTLAGEKAPDGRLLVYVTAQDLEHNGNTQHVTADDSTTLTSDYINTLKSQIASLEADKEALERDKEHLREESVRKDHIIMSLTQRIPAIEAPAAEATEPRESSVTASEDPVKGDVPTDSVDGENRQSWWQRWFGG
jgi:hypothetical protein